MFPTTSSSGARPVSLSRGWGLALAFFAALATVTPAGAADRLAIKPSLSVSQEYDTNLLYSSRFEEDDTFTRVVPGLEISSQGDRQSFLVRGELIGLYYREFDELDALDSSLHAEAIRAITPRLQAFVSTDLVYRDSTDPIGDDLDAVEGDQITVSGRGDLSRRWAQGGISYGFDALTTLRLTGSASKVSYGERRLVGGGSAPRLANDYDTRGATVLVERILSARDVVGVWVTYDLFDFSTPPPVGFLAATAREERRIRLGLSWQHAISAVWSMDFRGGPRWLHTEGGELASFGGIPLNRPTQKDDSLAFNGDITLTRVTPLSRLELSYSRDTRPSTDRGASQNLDDFGVSFSRKIGRRFSWRVKGLWRKEESSSESDRLDRRTMGFDVELRWRIRRHLHTFVGYGFQDRETDRISNDVSVDDQRVKIGFRYSHDFDFF